MKAGGPGTSPAEHELQSDDGKSTCSHLSYILIKAVQSKRNKEVCVIPTGRLLLKFLFHLIPTNSRKMLMKLERIQERATEITEGLKSSLLRKKRRDLTYLVYSDVCWPGNCLLFKHGEERYYSLHTEKQIQKMENRAGRIQSIFHMLSWG